jgi:predicted negative regulator of RcsB-dependent stress response
MENTLDNVKYFWADLPKWAKGVALIAVIAIPSYIGYKIYKNKQDEKERLKALEDLNKVDDQIRNLKNQGQVPSHSDAQYNQFADDLFQAMKGCGTEVNKIYKVFDKMYNDIDVYKLILAYGVDKELTCWASSNVKGGLAQALSSELGFGILTNRFTSSFGYVCFHTYELDVVNCILSKKGIKFQF